MNNMDNLAPAPRDNARPLPAPHMTTGRERMISQTYSNQWVPSHPGAPITSNSCTADAYAPAGSYQRPAASGTRQETCTSAFDLQHPAPTKADQNSLPLPPHRVVPCLLYTSPSPRDS
eukprot:TRINITY_DN8258_c0_g1_i1.p1 TRINITY_DN8258_c0_g1~~TRINITY_DN8258_c0_g1_i1.p1  ORF type:complete len:118 (+),score=19.35 TRINITY_DN8258_c0_g1_i1:211-564(+)